MAGLKAAYARGKKGGRPRRLDDAQISVVKKLYAEKNNSVAEIGAMFHISRYTVFRIVKTSVNLDTPSTIPVS